MLPGSNVSAPYKKIGAWVDKANNTNFQAATDGFVCACTTFATSQKAEGFTDDTATPTKEFFHVEGTAVNSNTQSFSMFVKKGNYWRAVLTTKLYLHWIPLEP